MTHALEIGTDTPEGFARGLRGYVGKVAAELGVGLESSVIDPSPPASVYIALDTKLIRFPGRDLALLWDERFGWSGAVETHSGEDLIIIAYQGGDLLPEAGDVAAFVDDLADGLVTDLTAPQTTERLSRADLATRLADYASPW